MGLKNNMKEQLVSVTIVTFNRKKELKKAIDSVLAQTYKNIEIIIVDNNSTDNTVKMITENYRMVKLIKSPTNVGCPKGRNIAIENSTGDIIFFLDDDAWYEKKFVESIVSKFENSSNEVYIIMPNMIEYFNGKKYRAFSLKHKNEIYIYNFSAGISAFRKELFKKIGYFSDTKYGSEENYLSIKMYADNLKVLFAPDLFVHHKPSFVRDKKELLYQSIKNDLMWAWTSSPIILLFPLLIWKSISWLKVGIRSICVNASLNGIWKGFFVNASKNDRVKIDIKINSYFKFLIERRNLIRLNSKQKFSK